MATNRHDTLDPALLRPGRLDRKIEFPLPDRRQKRLIFSTITSRYSEHMNNGLVWYSQHPKTGLSGFPVVTFRTLFSLVFECLAAILFLSFQIWTRCSVFEWLA
jgi:SpoVK/Ycf46/Vps4 family AAA+-type ATPase